MPPRPCASASCRCARRSEVPGRQRAVPIGGGGAASRWPRRSARSRSRDPGCSRLRDLRTRGVRRARPPAGGHRFRGAALSPPLAQTVGRPVPAWRGAPPRQPGRSPAGQLPCTGIGAGRRQPRGDRAVAIPRPLASAARAAELIQGRLYILRPLRRLASGNRSELRLGGTRSTRIVLRRDVRLRRTRHSTAGIRGSLDQAQLRREPRPVGIARTADRATVVSRATVSRG